MEKKNPGETALKYNVSSQLWVLKALPEKTYTHHHHHTHTLAMKTEM